MRRNQCHAVRTVSAVLAGESLTKSLRRLWVQHPELSAQDRGAIQDLSYGSLRHWRELQAYVDAMVERPVKDARVTQLLCVALYQLIYTRNATHAVVNEAVAACRLLNCHHLGGFVNALLRRFLSEHEVLRASLRADPALCHAYPDWWVRQLRERWPQDYVAQLEAGNLHPGMTLRVNRRRMQRDAYLELLANSGMGASAVGEDAVILERPVPVERLPLFESGVVSVQDYGAQLVPLLLDLKHGMRVCDACAAPGGKTAHILEHYDVDMTALEVDAERMRSLGDTLARLGLQAQQTCADAADLSAWWDATPFQRVLLDAPCSASGVVRRHPDIKWLRRSQDIENFVVQQRRLLEALWHVVEPGGKLLYVTCSVFKAENEDVIERFLQHHGDATWLPARAPLDAYGRLMISATHDGFFYALLEKRA